MTSEDIYLLAEIRQVDADAVNVVLKVFFLLLLDSSLHRSRLFYLKMPRENSCAVPFFITSQTICLFNNQLSA